MLAWLNFLNNEVKVRQRLRRDQNATDQLQAELDKVS